MSLGGRPPTCHMKGVGGWVEAACHKGGSPLSLGGGGGGRLLVLP